LGAISPAVSTLTGATSITPTTFNIGVGTAKGERRLLGVADGIDPADAVNKRQLEAVSIEARRGMAKNAALAASLAQTSLLGDSPPLSVAVGGFKGEYGLAIGIGGQLDNASGYKLGVSVGTGGKDPVWSASYGWKFD
jgi:hypothetical protein